MVKKLPPSEIQVNQDLQSARAMQYQEFLDVKDGRVDPEELSSAEFEFYDSIRELARSIKNSRQHYPSTCRRVTNSHGEDHLELVTGYRRYLACVYIGCPVRVEVRRMSDDQVLDLIYNENENREDLDPYDRAVVIAKKMGRWDHEEGYLPERHEKSDPNADTIAEFAEKVGKHRSQIYQQLSPVRQADEVRDEFSEALPESTLTLIERIATNTQEQYTLAQAFARSDVDTHTKFQSSYKLAKRKDGDTIKNICRSLIGLECQDVKGSYKSPEETMSSSLKRIKEKEERLKEHEEQEVGVSEKSTGQDFGEPAPAPDIDVNVGGPEKEEEVENNGVGYDGDSGTSMLPSREDQPHSDDQLDVTLPSGEKISKLVREECEERDMSPSDFVADVVRIHFRREGQLQDIPELTQME